MTGSNPDPLAIQYSTMMQRGMVEVVLDGGLKAVIVLAMDGTVTGVWHKLRYPDPNGGIGEMVPVTQNDDPMWINRTMVEQICGLNDQQAQMVSRVFGSIMAVAAGGNSFWQVRTMGQWTEWQRRSAQVSWADLSRLALLPTFQTELMAVRNVGPESAALFIQVLHVLRERLWNI